LKYSSTVLIRLRTKAKLYIEWVATVSFLISVALTSLNYYPEYLYASLLTNLLWLLVGIIWKKWSLIIVEAVVCIMYAVGIVKYWIA
jgi:hypothetical protein